MRIYPISLLLLLAACSEAPEDAWSVQEIECKALMPGASFDDCHIMIALAVGAGPPPVRVERVVPVDDREIRVEVEIRTTEDFPDTIYNGKVRLFVHNQQECELRSATEDLLHPGQATAGDVDHVLVVGFSGDYCWFSGGKVGRFSLRFGTEPGDDAWPAIDVIARKGNSAIDGDLARHLVELRSPKRASQPELPRPSGQRQQLRKETGDPP